CTGRSSAGPRPSRSATVWSPARSQEVKSLPRIVPTDESGIRSVVFQGKSETAWAATCRADRIDTGSHTGIAAIDAENRVCRAAKDEDFIYAVETCSAVVLH